jgi:hypothetical protein
MHDYIGTQVTGALSERNVLLPLAGAGILLPLCLLRDFGLLAYTRYVVSFRLCCVCVCVFPQGLWSPRIHQVRCFLSSMCVCVCMFQFFSFLSSGCQMDLNLLAYTRYVVCFCLYFLSLFHFVSGSFWVPVTLRSTIIQHIYFLFFILPFLPLSGI